jgi:hypothetical protein
MYKAENEGKEFNMSIVSKNFKVAINGIELGAHSMKARPMKKGQFRRRLPPWDAQPGP